MIDSTDEALRRVKDREAGKTRPGWPLAVGENRELK